MKKERLHFLFHLYINQACTPSEEAELMQLLADSSRDEELGKLVDECFDNLRETYQLKDADADSMFQAIVDKPVRRLYPSFLKNNSGLRWFGAAAAVALLFITITVVMFRNTKPVNEINQVVEIVKPINKPLYKNDVRPGGNKAILTLADGSKIVLDDAAEGALTRQGNTTIIKLSSGKLAYNMQTVSKIPSKKVLYNTLTTPRGGQYCVTLPEGTTVWLNSSSSLRFPTAFAGKERRVEVIGEAYFEVAKNAEMPFIVKAGNEEIKVLGTHFNVLAYADEKIIRTTLLEGSVEVSITKQTTSEPENKVITLVPGQQSMLDEGNALSVVEIDTEEAIAWKKGYFIFNNENIENVMLKISRWYDVKVIYEGSLGNKNFTGNISRSKNVSDVLDMLELTEAIHFKIEEKTITVLP